MRTQGSPGALRWLAVAAGALAALALPVTAQASFPGSNGEIVYGWIGVGQYRGAPAPTSIRAVDPRSGSVRVLRDCPMGEQPPLDPQCSVSAPRYSPDGLRIALLTGLPWQLRPGLGAMASDGTGFQEHATAHIYQRLAWSPAGDRLLLERPIPSPEYPRPNAIVLASLDGAELGQVTPEQSGAPDWSSTGEIAFARYRQTCVRICSNIYLTRLLGAPRRLTRRGGDSPSWSPHGTRLAFARYARSARRAGIYLVRRDGLGLRQLTRGGHNPSWSPDGKWIAFIRARDLYVIRTDGRDLRRLVNEAWNGLDGTAVNSIDWQPLPRRQ